MGQCEELVVQRPEFDELADRVDRLEGKVDNGFAAMKAFEERTETQFFEIRRELAHHSEILTSHSEQLTSLQQGQKKLAQDVAAVRQEHMETRNMVQQILDIVRTKA